MRRAKRGRPAERKNAIQSVTADGLAIERCYVCGEQVRVLEIEMVRDNAGH